MCCDSRGLCVSHVVNTSTSQSIGQALPARASLRMSLTTAWVKTPSRFVLWFAAHSSQCASECTDFSIVWSLPCLPLNHRLCSNCVLRPHTLPSRNSGHVHWMNEKSVLRAQYPSESILWHTVSLKLQGFLFLIFEIETPVVQAGLRFIM